MNPVDYRQIRLVDLDRRTGENEAGANHAGNWGADGRVGQLQTRHFGRRATGSQVGCGSRFVGADVVDLFFRDEIAVPEC